MAQKQKRKAAQGDLATNRRARHDYELIERFECGIELLGTEVKALRDGHAQMSDAYAAVDDGEVWLRNLHIPPYPPAALDNHEPERPRRLLLNRYEIERLIGQSQRKGLTLIPLRIYPKSGRIKVEIALAKGKDRRDRRRELRDRDTRREVERELAERMR